MQLDVKSPIRDGIRPLNMIRRILGKTGVEVRARQVLLAVLATACAATTSSSLAPASLEVGDVVRKTREQYAQVQDGYGKAWMETRHVTEDGEWAVLSTQDIRIVFDATNAQVRYKQEVNLPDREKPFKDYKVEYFTDQWRQGSAANTSTDAETSSQPSPSKEALNAHPTHHMGLFPKEALILLEEAERRSKIEIVGTENYRGLACLVLKGTIDVEDEDTYEIQFWLAEERGYLPVKMHAPIPKRGIECVATFEYTAPTLGVWVLSRGLSVLNRQGKVLMQQEIVFAPDFAVNTGADPYFSDVASMFPDDNMWEKQALNAVSK
jgi:hypothetical protein